MASGKGLLLAALLLVPAQLFAQAYSMNWFKIAGGGGASSNGVYALSATIGQPDASGAMTGGNYSLTGGFWSLIALVQNAGAPVLTITRAGASVVVSWPNTGSYTLQQNSNLSASAGWISSGYSVSASNGTNSITLTNPKGNLFFRLANP
jgi:hypothetical protein